MYLPLGSKLTNQKGEVYTIEPIVNNTFWPWPNMPIPEGTNPKDFLGRGGFGITYLASHEISVGGIPQIHWFAIKEYFDKNNCKRDVDGHTVIFNNPEAQEGIESFIKEAKRLKELSHDNIVKVVDDFKCNGTAYYVMQFLEGGTFQDKVTPEKPLSEAEAINLMQPVMEAVEYMHSKHLMHCDIKPNNIVLHKNKPVLIDFGESLHFNEKGNLTTTRGQEPGRTKGYCPPEQPNGFKSFEPTCDVYALGATLFFLVTGKHPENCTDIKPNYFHETLRIPGVSDQLYNAIVHAMAYNKYERTPSVAALMQELGTRSMPDPLPVGYRLNHGVDEYEIISEGKICSNYIEYLVLHLTKNEQIGYTQRVRYKLYEYFVEGTTSRERNYHLQHVSCNGSAYSSFLRMSKEHESYQDFQSFEANGTSYFVHRRRTMPKPSPNLWKKVGGVVACIAGVALVTYGGYYAATHIDWKRWLIPKSSTIEVSNISFDIAEIDSLDNIDVAYLKANEMLRYTYSGEATADSIPNGRGTAKFDDGTKYDGLFVNGVCRDTAATFTFTDGSVFKGAVDNYFCMNGRLTDKEGSYFIGHFIKNSPDKNNGNFYFEDGRKKEEVKNLSWDISSNESIPAEDMELLKSFNMTRYTYSGTTADGVPHGYGIAKFGSHIYEGKFVNGLGVDDNAECFNAADQVHFQGKIVNFIYIYGTVDGPNNYHRKGYFKDGALLEE